jgi:hypothetical protein
MKLGLTMLSKLSDEAERIDVNLQLADKLADGFKILTQLKVDYKES